MKILVYKLLHAISLICIVSNVVNAQSLKTGGSHIVLPSPNAWNSLNESKADVDLYTGKLNYSIPLHALKSRELEIPISLQYSTDGVKVDDLPSDVGLGWQLNAGGVIGRVMRGLPDEFDGPYSVRLSNGSPATISAKGFLDLNVGDYADLDYFTSASRSVDDRKRIIEYSNKTGDYVSLGQNPKIWDTEPDEFYFNFDRYSGKFVFDKSGAIQIIPHQNLQITKVVSTNLYSANEAGNSMITSFQITDERGIKFTFGNVNPTSKAGMTAIEVTKYSLFSVSFQLAYYFDAIATSVAWNQGLLVNLFSTTPALLLDNEVANFEISSTDNKQTFTSSWFLTKVESPNADYIDLVYKNEDIKYLTGRTHDISQLNLDLYNYGESYLFGTDANNDIPLTTSATGHKYQGQNFNVTTSKSTINSKKPLSITASTGEKVTFESEVVRPDLVGGKRLDRVKIFNSSNQLIKTYNFNFDLSVSSFEEYLYEFKVRTTTGFYYPHEFMSNYQNYIYSSVPQNSEWLELLEADHFRMLLSSIDETFVGGVSKEIASFEYNTDFILPPRFSSKQDYYGYFNSNPAGHTFRPVTYNDTYNTSVPMPILFGSMFWDENNLLYMRSATPNHAGVTEKAKAGTLKNIFFKNGSKISIEYERNQGLRVSRISNFPNASKMESEDVNFVYSNSQTNSLSAKFSNSLSLKTINGGATRTTLYSSSTPINQSLQRTKGGFVGYGTVEKIRSGIGKEIFEFSNPGSHPNTDFTRYDVYDDSNGKAIQLSTCDCFPFAPKNNIDYQRGLVKKVTIKNHSDQILKTDTYNYEINPTGYTPIKVFGLKPGRYVFDQIPRFVAAFYYYKTDWVYLDNVESKIFDQSDPGNESKSLVTTTQYHYNRPGESSPVADLLARKVTTTLPTGDRVINETKYPLDYTTTPTPTDVTAKGIHLLKTKKIENIPIETISYVEKTTGGTTTKYLLGASLTKFKDFGSGKVYYWEAYKYKPGLGIAFTTYPWSSVVSNAFSWSNSTNFKLASQVTSYDTFGNPTASIDEDGIQSNYTWGYNNSLLTSSTQNTGTYQHQTNYLHTPLIGVTQVKDPNSRNTNYTYDNFNRLKHVKDHSNNIQTQFRYHYRDQVESLSNNSISIIGCPQPGQAVNFSSAVSSDFGETKYHWNFGDGSSISTTSTSTPHTYSTIGTYQVTVRRENPEYSSSDAVVNVTVSNPISGINIFVNGPTSIDICDGFNVVSPTFFSIDPRGTASIQWDYRYNSGPWYNLGSGDPGVESPPGFEPLGSIGSYDVRCTVTDTCGNVYTNSVSLQVYSSNPFCAQY